MDPLDTATEVLDSIFGYLGFAATVEADRQAATLRVATGDAKLLIGRRGERIEEIQHLVNRIVQERIPNAPTCKVDIDNYLASKEFRLIEEAEAVAARVLATGRPAKLEPMNSYQRRLVHRHFKDHPEIRSRSPEDSARLKRITLELRNPAETGDGA